MREGRLLVDKKNRVEIGVRVEGIAYLSLYIRECVNSITAFVEAVQVIVRFQLPDAFIKDF